MFHISFDKDLPDRETVEELNKKDAEGYNNADGRYSVLKFVAIISIIAFLFLILGRAM